MTADTRPGQLVEWDSWPHARRGEVIRVGDIGEADANDALLRLPMGTTWRRDGALCQVRCSTEGCACTGSWPNFPGWLHHVNEHSLRPVSDHEWTPNLW